MSVPPVRPTHTGFGFPRGVTATYPRHKEEATRSWWLNPGTREQFDAAVAREQGRILRSKASTLALGSNIIVGWNSSGRSGRKP